MDQRKHERRQAAVAMRRLNKSGLLKQGFNLTYRILTYKADKTESEINFVLHIPELAIRIVSDGKQTRYKHKLTGLLYKFKGYFTDSHAYFLQGSLHRYKQSDKEHRNGYIHSHIQSARDPNRSSSICYGSSSLMGASYPLNSGYLFLFEAYNFLSVQDNDHRPHMNFQRLDYSQQNITTLPIDTIQEMAATVAPFVIDRLKWRSESDANLTALHLRCSNSIDNVVEHALDVFYSDVFVVKKRKQVYEIQNITPSYTFPSEIRDILSPKIPTIIYSEHGTITEAIDKRNTAVQISSYIQNEYLNLGRFTLSRSEIVFSSEGEAYIDEILA